MESNYETMDILQASQFLNMSVSALRAKVKQGTIKGAKPAKRWVFLKQDLVAFIRSHYDSTVEIPLSGSQQKKETPQCQYTNAVKATGSVSQHQMDREYAAQLGLEIRSKHRNTMIS
jgi:hypothetical protein